MNKNIKSSDELQILRKINNNPKLNQRDLASELGFSLGKLNYCLKSLRKKGHVKIENLSKNKNIINYKYLLTPKGISYKAKMLYFFLKQKAKEYEEIKKELRKR